MAITDVAKFAHLTSADLEAFAADLEKVSVDVEASRGERDRAYICRTIALQRGLDIASRLVIGLSRGRVGWALGTTGTCGREEHREHGTRGQHRPRSMGLDE
jgi:hypothetical protein